MAFSPVIVVVGVCMERFKSNRCCRLSRSALNCVLRSILLFMMLLPPPVVVSLAFVWMEFFC